MVDLAVAEATREGAVTGKTHMTKLGRVEDSDNDVIPSASPKTTTSKKF